MLGVIILFVFFWLALIGLAIYIRCQEFNYAVIIQWRYICNLLEKRTTLMGEMIITAMDVEFDDHKLFTKLQNQRLMGDAIYDVVERGRFERQLEEVAEEFLEKLLEHSPSAARPLEAQFEEINMLVLKARRDYNLLVKEMSRFMYTVPECFVARLMGFKPANFFQIDSSIEINEVPKLPI